MKSKLLYNFLGTLFDKGLILFVSFYLTSIITVKDFGKWALFLQLIIISSSLTFGPLYNIFSRSFSIGKRNKIQIYHFKELILLMVLLTFASHYYFNDIKIVLSFFLTLASFGIYNYLVVYFRFSNNDKKYFKFSLAKFLIFIFFVFIGFKINVDYFTTIISSFFLANFLVVLPFIKLIEFTKNKIFTKKEFFTLMLYGLFSSLLSGVDKIFIGTLEDDKLLGIYSYIIALSTASNLFVEVLKKSIVPSMFKDYNLKSKLSSKISKLRLNILLILFFIQIVTPFLLFYILLKINLVGEEFYNVDDFYIILFIQSFAFAIFSWYHFINPLFIFLKKSNIMSISMFTGIAIYSILFFISSDKNIFKLTIFKFFLLILPTIISGIYSIHLLKIKKNE